MLIHCADIGGIKHGSMVTATAYELFLFDGNGLVHSDCGLRWREASQLTGRRGPWDTLRAFWVRTRLHYGHGLKRPKSTSEAS